MSGVAIELYFGVGTRDEQWNVCKRLALICHFLNKKQNQYTVENKGVLIKQHPHNSNGVVLVINGENSVTDDNDFYINRSTIENVQEADLQRSIQTIERAINEHVRNFGYARLTA